MKREMKEMTESMRTMESDEQKMQMLAEIQGLSKELEQLKQQGR